MLTDRVNALEQAVIALCRAEFGDEPGHRFHGNQYVDAGEESKGDKKERKETEEKWGKGPDTKDLRSFVYHLVGGDGKYDPKDGKKDKDKDKD